VALNTITLIPAWIDDITEILLKVALNTITLIPAWIDDITEILLKVALNTITLTHNDGINHHLDIR
jgi:hypothetical protein